MLETIADILQVYNITVITNLFISLLIIKVFYFATGKKTYSFSKEIIRWLLISGAVFNIVYYISDIFTQNQTPLTNRLTGPYAIEYWLMLFFACLLPFILLLNKVKSKGVIIFTVALLMNSGWLFEKYVIMITSLHRDYLPSSWSMSGPFQPLLTTVVRGIGTAIFITAISIIVTKFSKTKYKGAKAL